ncbi:hypothetical protein E2C01_031534 [Portunus trituberculatus]|uniref:Uncharacterized protein n=1 Tax=Portunus trituberculatus TaxID=210409 RepID=A0A5B7EYT8_PORTR|nr:hypothetical protein [Portunus trituberculatus]
MDHSLSPYRGRGSGCTALFDTVCPRGMAVIISSDDSTLRPSSSQEARSETEDDTLGIAWNVPGKYHGNGNNKQQHCNAPQNVSLVLSNYRIEKFPSRSFYHDRTHSTRNTEEGGKQNASP